VVATEALLRQGDRQGRSCLLLAPCVAGQAQAVEALLRGGGGALVAERAAGWGAECVEAARRGNHGRVLALLAEAGAEVGDGDPDGGPGSG
jgi:hypothetical protein